MARWQSYLCPVSMPRSPHRTCVFPRIRRSTDSQSVHWAGCCFHGEGMLFARHRYRVTSTVAVSNMTVPFANGRLPGLPVR